MAVESVIIPVGGGRAVTADIALPENARGLILFAHGSGSNRNSPRNRRIAELLQQAGFATVLVDLIAQGEEPARPEDAATLRADVPFLAERLLDVTRWLERHPRLGSLPRGLFGAYTGAAAALLAAALRPDGVRAVVSRGGHLDRASEALENVLAPILLVVGERDEALRPSNAQAQARLGARARLEIVEGASHLFEEPGALERVAELARDFFSEHLPAGDVRPAQV